MTIGHPTETDAIFIGTQRPTRDAAIARWKESKHTCPMGHELTYTGTSIIASWKHEPQNCWKNGCYDDPVYVSLNELIAAGWKPKEPLQ